MATIAEQITELEELRAEYILARSAILRGGQSYSIGNRSLDRGNLSEINKELQKIDTKLVTLRAGNRIRIQRVVPRDGI